MEGTETIQGLIDNESAIIGTAGAFIALTSISFLLRVFSKRLTGSPIGLEDWTALLALAIFLAAEILVIRSDLIGRTGRAETADDLAFDTYTIYVHIYSSFYFAVVSLCLASILFLYRKLFIRKTVQRITFCMLLVVGGFAIETFIIETFGAPPAVAIPHDPDVPSWHVTYISFWLANGIIEQILTLIAILIPVAQVYKLQLSLRKKLSVALVFAISGLCFVTGILRLALLYRPGSKAVALVLGDILLNIHLGTAILSANLPVCWPIISRRSQVAAAITRRTRSITNRTATTDTLHMNDVALPHKLSVAHLQSGNEHSFDPRGATTWTDATRASSNDSQFDGFDHAAARLEEGNIAVIKTVDVTRSN